MDIEWLKVFTRDVVEEYEAIRQWGGTNMFDMGRVQSLARTALADLTREQYGELLCNYGKLLKHYGIEQPEQSVTNL